MFNKIGQKLVMVGVFFGVALSGAVVEAQSVPPSGHSDPSSVEPTLLKKETLDVNNDGVLDVVSYFDSNGDDVVDAEAIDLGSTGTVTVLAIRCDADSDGREDDWAVVNAATKEITAALIDANDDGDADSVAYGNGELESLPVVSELVSSAFHY